MITYLSKLSEFQSICLFTEFTGSRHLSDVPPWSLALKQST